MLNGREKTLDLNKDKEAFVGHCLSRWVKRNKSLEEDRHGLNCEKLEKGTHKGWWLYKLQGIAKQEWVLLNYFYLKGVK